MRQHHRCPEAFAEAPAAIARLHSRSTVAPCASSTTTRSADTRRRFHEIATGTGRRPGPSLDIERDQTFVARSQTVPPGSPASPPPPNPNIQIDCTDCGVDADIAIESREGFPYAIQAVAEKGAKIVKPA